MKHSADLMRSFQQPALNKTAHHPRKQNEDVLEMAQAYDRRCGAGPGIYRDLDLVFQDSPRRIGVHAGSGRSPGDHTASCSHAHACRNDH